MAEIKIYSAVVCPYAHRSRLVLQEKGIDFDLIEIDLQNKPEGFTDIGFGIPEEFTRLRRWKKALKQRDSVVAFVFDVAAGIANSKEFYIERYARFATPVAA